MDTNLFWAVSGPYDKMKAGLAGMSREWLEAAILDDVYNDFLGRYADYRDGEKSPHGHGKRLPYIGWSWRHLPFHSGALPIGNCREFIGFMANNKWDYAERVTTPEEFADIMAIIDEAMRLSRQGGNVSEIMKETYAKLGELWDYMQGLRI